MLTSLKQNLTFGVRTLLKTPGFTATIVLTIALGIGASTAIFSVLYATLFERLPYPKSEQLMMVWSRVRPEGRNVVSAGDFLDWKKRNTTFQDMHAWSGGGSFNLATNDRPEEVQAVASTPGFNNMVGVEFLLGRDFIPEEAVLGNNRVVILTHKLWNTRFGADRNIVGKQIRMNGEPFTVVGVFATGLADRGGSQVSIPLAFRPEQINHDNHWILVMGRLKDGVTGDQAQAEMSGIAAQLEQEFPESNKDWKVSVEPLHLNFLPKTTQRRLWLLQGAVGFLLLIACVNVANLLLARSTTRRREVGLRSALGATRTRIFGQLLTESLMLSIAGGVLGILLASFLIKAIIAILPVNFLPIEADIRISIPVLFFTVGATVLSGLIFGCIPAWQATRVDLNEVLKQGGRTGSGSGKRGLRRALVVAEFALALTTLAAGGLTLKSFWNLSRVDLGINPEHVLTFNLAPSDKRFPEVKNIVPYYRQVLERIESVPGVKSAAFSTGLPTRGTGFGMTFRIVGGPVVDDSALPGCSFGLITAGYTETLGVRITRGRGFDQRDTESSVRVAMINEKLAQTYFADVDPIGQRVAVDEIIPPGKLGPPIEWQIVGVFQNVRNDGLRNEFEEIDVPFWQMPWQRVTAIVRTEGEPTAVTRSIASSINSFDPDLPLAGVATMDDVVSEQFAPDRFALALFGGFALAALLLAAIGVYGVMAFGVAQRTQEFGIRMALGAQSNRVLKMVLQEGTILALIGSVLGIAGAYAVGRLMQSTLYGVPAFDTWAFIAMVAVLLIAAILASFLPAWRASRVEPITALRCD
jgi:putative ABC transport system permease protein